MNTHIYSRDFQSKILRPSFHSAQSCFQIKAGSKLVTALCTICIHKGSSRSDVCTLLALPVRKRSRDLYYFNNDWLEKVIDITCYSHLGFCIVRNLNIIVMVPTIWWLLSAWFSYATSKATYQICASLKYWDSGTLLKFMWFLLYHALPSQYQKYVVQEKPNNFEIVPLF